MLSGISQSLLGVTSHNIWQTKQCWGWNLSLPHAKYMLQSSVFLEHQTIFYLKEWELGETTGVQHMPFMQPIPDYPWNYVLP